MYDMHYDLLTSLYFNCIKGNDKADILKLFEQIKEIYRVGNIKGGIINLYFDDAKTMDEEMGIPKEDLEDVSVMLDQSLACLESVREKLMIDTNISIPDPSEFLIGIEGTHNVKEGEIPHLAEQGVNTVIITYLKESICGCGSNIEPEKDYGLSAFGKNQAREFLEHGIALDISHASKKSVDDLFQIAEDYRREGNEAILLASHSNCRSICNRPRNLTDEQIIQLRDMGGYLGLFTNNNFVYLKQEGETFRAFDKRPRDFMKHLNHVIQDLNYPIEKIFISTDDMDFNPDESYHNLWTYPIGEINSKLRNTIQEVYGSYVTEMLMSSNAKTFIDKVKQNKKNKIK